MMKGWSIRMTDASSDGGHYQMRKEKKDEEKERMSKKSDSAKQAPASIHLIELRIGTAICSTGSMPVLMFSMSRGIDSGRPLRSGLVARPMPPPLQRLIVETPGGRLWGAGGDKKFQAP
jgi:hypothetical protein